MTQHVHRREFLKGAAMAASAFSLSGCASLDKKPSVRPRISPNEKLNIGIIGVENQGHANTEQVISENIVALCDIDALNLGKASERFPKARTYKDWRELLDQKDVDAVVISTADQVHAPAAVKAMRLGKHVYCEKPLAHSVHEARVVRETYHACRDKVATQMGTQIHATENYRRVVELVRDGAIGPVREVHVWCNRKGPGGMLPEGSQPVPDHLSWDFWLGPAPYRPYNSAYLPGNLTWNRYWDFGNGTLGDMGSHLIDLPFWALELQYPTSVEATGSPVNPHTNPTWLVATWEHPARGNRPALKLTWHDAEKRPKSPPGIDLMQWKIGVMFIGDAGKLLADYDKHILLPNKDYRGFEPPKTRIEPSAGHHAEWIRACKTGSPTLCNFDYSGLLIEHNLLGNVAYRTGQKLQWDHKNLKATGCPEADQYIRREYRKGWTL
ncbi:MAG TPA: Gfo/Idh/MocA family oxidoreductase [Phycisphaerae bacterium]|nr:Gfo/Idh/MocA family oxidoreductase [Phycisphaerae bacterium]